MSSVRSKVRSHKQFVRVFQSEHMHARESIRLLLISIPVYLSELWCFGVLDQVNNVALLLKQPGEFHS